MLLDFTNPRLPVGVRADKVFGSMNTPNSIALDMVNITWKEIKDRVDKDWVFLNVCCKTGVFPTNLFDKLVTCKNLVKAFPNYYERRHWILENMIKCVSTNQTAKEFSGLYLYGLDYIVYEHNIKVIPENEVCAYLRNTYKLQRLNSEDLTDEEFYNIVNKHKHLWNGITDKDKIKSIVIEDISTKYLDFEGENMRFDVVIGNPPYNRDIYVDFVTAGHKLASKFSCWITPAKWQAKGGAKNEAFRKEVAPYIKQITYYPNEKDIFDINCQGGITYFTTDNQIHINKLINGEEYKNWNIKYGFNYDNRVTNIVEKIKEKISNTVTEDGSSFVPMAWWNCTIDLGRDKDKDIYDNTSKYAIVNSSRKVHIKECWIKNVENAKLYSLVHSHWVRNTFAGKIYSPFELTDGSTVTLFAGTKEECDSALSYYNCKLIWWLVYNFNGKGGLTTKSFKLVPDPGEFDHIFTDEELYKKYGLTDEEINIIESVIKERT